MADEVWKELAESPELSDAMSSLCAETMPDSVAQQILHALPPGGGPGGAAASATNATSQTSTLGSSAAGWAIAAVALGGLLGAGLLWYSLAPGSPSAAPDLSLGRTSDEASPLVGMRQIQAQPPIQPIERSNRSDLPAATVETPRASSDSSRTSAPPNARHALDSARQMNEIQLLEQARSLLGAHPARALRLLRVHARRFPQSQLTQEREVLRIEALISGGHPERATRLAERFLSRYPSSAHRGRVEALRDRASAP